MALRAVVAFVWVAVAAANVEELMRVNTFTGDVEALFRL